MKKLIIAVIILSIMTMACGKKVEDNGKLNVLATTTNLRDLLQNIAKDKVNLVGLMGSGVDPHLYKASEGDVAKLANADVLILNGLHLEGKMEDIFEKMEHSGKLVLRASDAIDKSQLISSENFASNYDPHIWFNIDYWSKIAKYLSKELIKKDPENKEAYEKNTVEYLAKLKELSNYVNSKAKELPKEERVLITAHDAFNYFGNAYNFKVLGLQGLSTKSEAGVFDVKNLANYIYKNKIKAIFIESSVPRRNIEALQASVRAKGFEVKIGGELFSDSLGTKGTKEGEYLGMYKHNIDTIVNALK